MPDPDDHWILLQTENFTIYSSADGKTARNIGIKLERLRKTLTLLTSVKNLNSPVPTWIYIFKDDVSLKPYLFDVYGKVPDLGGYFIAHSEGNYIATSAANRSMRTILHEYIHFFTNNNMPDLPLWFNEGFAEYYSTFQSDDNLAKIGLPVTYHVDLLRSTSLMPLEELFSIHQGSIFYTEESTQSVFYAQSWLLVHYLIRGKNGAFKSKLNHFLTLLKRGQAAEEAFKKSFKWSYGQLQKELESYLMKGSFDYIQISSDELDISPHISVRTLAYEEVLYHLGDLILHHQNPRIAEAEFYFRKAMALNPNYALAYCGLGAVNIVRDNHREALDFLKIAVKLDPQNAVIQQKYGFCTLETQIKSRLRISYSDPSIKDALTEARGAFQKAIMLDPKFYEAYAGFGETFIYDLQTPIDAGIKALEKAHKQLPTRMDVAVNLLTLYARKGDSLRVNALFEKVIKKRADSRTIRIAQKRLIQIELQKVHQLLNQGRNEQAVQKLARLPDLPQEPQLSRQITLLRETALRNEQVGLYNRAVRLANRKNFEEAVALLQKSIAINQDAEFTTRGQETLEKVKQNLYADYYNEAAYLINENKKKQAEKLLKIVVENSKDRELIKMAKEALEYIKGK